MDAAANSLSRPAVEVSVASGDVTRRRAVITLYLAAGGAAILANLFVGAQIAAVSFVATSALAFAALLVGPMVYRPRGVLPWRWLAAGIGAFLLGNVARLAVLAGGSAELAWLADVGYVGYVFLAIGLMTFIRVRRPRYRLARLVDGLAIGCVAALAMSQATLENAAAAGLDAYGSLGLLITPVFEALLLGATAYLVFAGGGLRSRSQQLLLLGIAAMGGADLLYYLQAGAGAPPRTLIDTLWMTSYLLVGLTALVPSMRGLTEPQTEEPERGAARAIMALVGAVAALTALDVLGKLTTSGSGGAWFEVAEVALITLVFVRALGAARLETARERRVVALLSNAADALAVVGIDGEIKFANPAAAEMVGVELGNSIGRPIFELFDRVHPDERADMRRRMINVLATPGATDTAVLHLDDQAGGHRSVEITATNRLSDPAVNGVVLNLHDVTDELRTTAELHRLGTAIQQASDGVLITNAKAEIEYVNPAFERITGYSRDEVIGQNPRFLQSGEQPPAFYEAMWQTLSAGLPWRADFVNRRKDGTMYRMAAVITPLHDAGRRVTGYVGVSRDLTRQRKLETAAQDMARERALVAETIRGIDPHASPEEVAQAVCVQLASMNDVAMAGLFIYEGSGRAAQYGFVVSSGEQAPRRGVPKSRTNYLRERTDAGPWIEAWIDRPGHPYNALITSEGVKAFAYAPVRDHGRAIGFVVVGSASPDAEERLASMLLVTLECGDIAGAMLGVKVAERSELSAERRRISQIIDSRAFFPVYQPLLDVLTGSIVGYEALTRFEDGTPPEVRFAEAHEAGLGEKLELAAVQAALEGATAIPRDLWLNINASPAVVLGDGELARMVNETARDIVLEVTEHTQINDYAAFRRAVQELGPKVRLAVDDAGAGFASLRHIIELRPAFVKLDRQVIAGIDGDEARQAMVAGLRHFALNTGCWLIAEGVETADELQTLRDLEVRYVQGYLLGRPMPPHRLAEFDAVVGGATLSSSGVRSSAAALTRARRK